MKPSKCGICCLWILQRLTYKQVQWMVRPSRAHLGLSNPVGLCSPQLSNVLKKQLDSWMQAKLGDPFFCIPHKVPHCPPAAQQGIQSLARHPPLPLTEHTEQLSLKWTTGLHPATPNTHTTTQHSAEEETQAPQHPLINLPRAGAMLIILLPS